MTEKEFFSRLEWRISHEMAGMRDRTLRRYWCDGFLWDEFLVSSARCRMIGKVYFGETGQDVWDFVILLGSESTDREKINWEKLLPAKDVTGWLALDFEKRFMKINPFVARPDGEGVAADRERPGNQAV